MGAPTEALRATVLILVRVGKGWQLFSEERLDEKQAQNRNHYRDTRGLGCSSPVEQKLCAVSRVSRSGRDVHAGGGGAAHLGQSAHDLPLDRGREAALHGNPGRSPAGL